MYAGVIVKTTDVKVDYSKWLGPDYKSLYQWRVSTYVCNHIGYTDVPVLIYSFSGNCGFLAADYVEHAPLIGGLAKAMDGLFCPRGGSDEAK